MALSLTILSFQADLLLVLTKETLLFTRLAIGLDSSTL
jgi:hypothetical protein